MITSVRSQDLATKIEQVVREYIAAGRQVAKAAVERAFAEAETATVCYIIEITGVLPSRRHYCRRHLPG